MPKGKAALPSVGGGSPEAQNATNAYLTGAGMDGFIQSLDQQNLPVKEIELYKIHKRPVNKYHMIDNIELDESIRQYGLINPIAVCHHLDEDDYVISAGERRYEAVSRLHERYPDNPRFQKIECKVYILTDDKALLEQGFPYITEEQEEGIYRDSNNLARQLTDNEIASQVRILLKKCEDPEFVKRLKESAKAAGTKTYDKPDIAKLVISVMKSQGCWGAEKVRQYKIVYDSHNTQLLDDIEEKKISVYAAYQAVVKQQQRKRKRKTNKIQQMKKSIEELCIEASTQPYTDKEIEKLKEYSDRLMELYNKLSNK